MPGELGIQRQLDVPARPVPVAEMNRRLVEAAAFKQYQAAGRLAVHLHAHAHGGWVTCEDHRRGGGIRASRPATHGAGVA
jgi:hypothetical protein